MNRKCVIYILLMSLSLVACVQSSEVSNLQDEPERTEMKIILPQPVVKSNISLEEALSLRRSVREFSTEPLHLSDISQLLWAAQGITSSEGYRTAPSAGGLYPLEIYVVTANVDDLPPGCYHYRPLAHDLEVVTSENLVSELAAAALDQSWVENAAANFIISAVYERTTEKYGERGIRYVHLEAGHAAQNICLQAAALGIGVVTVGAFHDDKIAQVTGMGPEEAPLYVIPTGKKG